MDKWLNTQWLNESLLEATRIMGKVRAYCFWILLMISGMCAYGQGENNIWCFGQGKGLDFNGGPPVLYPNNLYAIEGCASVCDQNGNLLFYASPTQVWCSNNTMMPNGGGLSGNISATQGAVIEQSYSNPNQYYLFTMGVALGPSLYYSVIDMTLNGGLGDVVAGQKNILMDSNMLEKMILVKGNGCYTWLLVHHRDDSLFHAFKIDFSGVSSNPVISHTGMFSGLYAYDQGEMKASPNDSMIALANLRTYNLYGLKPSIELYSFNNSTGVVSNPATLDTMPVPIVVQQRWYGISFSPDGSKLYGGGYDAYLYQYDMSLMPNVPAVFNSRIKIDTTNSEYNGMRIGPDDKLYLLNNGAIAVINDPNLPGPACNYNPSLFPYVPANNPGSDFGNAYLPHASLSHNLVHDTTVCLINGYVVNAPAGYYSYLWNDGSVLQANTFFAAGTKWVISTSTCGISTDTFHVLQVAVVDTTVVTDTIICLVGDTPIFTAPAGYTSYTWSDGKTTQTDTMTTGGTKWVLSKTSECNKRTDTFHLSAAPIVTTSVVKDTFVCFVNNIPILSAAAGYNTYLWSDGFTIQQDTMSMPGIKWVQCQTGCAMLVDTFHLHEWRDTTKLVTDTSHCVAYSPITIYAPGGYLSYLWSDGKTTQVDTFFSTETKWVRALNGCNLLIDTVHFTATTIPQDSITMHGRDTTICFEAGAVSVAAPGGYTYYLWSDGTAIQTDIFNGPATRWVYAQKLCYLLIDTFAVSAHGTDTATSRMDTIVCFSNLATVEAPGGYLTYLWSDGNGGQQDTFSNTATKYVRMHRACEQAIDTFHVQFVNDLSVNLGNDTAVCKGEVVKLVATSPYAIAKYLWQDNSTAATYNVTEGGDYSVKVSVGPCSVSDTIRVRQKVIDVKLGNGLIPCNGTEITLDAGVDSASYLWQDGSKQRTFTATKEGTYSVKVTQGLCSATASVNVQFGGCPCVVVLPTAFSPNGDGKNDEFGAKISCDISEYKLMVYNRWGNQVFYTENVNEKWDGSRNGKVLDTDVYNYYMEFKDGDGKSYYYKGDITLVR